MESQTTDLKDLDARIVDALKTIFDPEIPVNIYDLGLIYKVDIDAEAKVDVQMTLTAPGCPVAGSLPGEVETKIKSVSGVSDAHVELVWEPAWSKDMLSEEA
ncbi:MAG: SUF system Fe-S cluster assembly protein, partial [Cyanobacteria bacterium REEB65]|nr:SUF system Fe-S cluster assembly protein [Cyanobacteria bacterium REEB65]